MSRAEVTGVTVLKLGGELVEQADILASIAQAIVSHARRGALVVIHGAGREIDAEMARRGLPKRAVDGLRITDAATLEAVIATLAGTVNTRVVAAIVAAGGRAVGLTGADDRLGLSRRASPYRTADGRVVNLELVGDPVVQPQPLLGLLCEAGVVPVVASIGVDATGALLNVNADTLASRVAAGLAADRLIVAGGTAGVLDADGRTLPFLDEGGIERLIAERHATAGMVAKLNACREALAAGVGDIRIVAVDGGDGGGTIGAWQGTSIARRSEFRSAGR